MLVEILRVRENGWALPRFRPCMSSAIRGELLVSDHHDTTLQRWTRVATLLDALTKAPLPSE